MPPVNGVWVEADLLHPLIRGRDVGRYCHETAGWQQIVPNRHYDEVETEEEFADRYTLTYSYLKNYEDLLKARATYRRYQRHLPFYVVYCVGSYSFSPYKVVWMEQQDPKAFRTCVISEDKTAITPNKLLVPDHKLYFAAFDSPEEAHYLSGYLNSRPVRTWLGGFLLGKQIGTTIFEYMKVPPFDPGRAECLEIAKTSLAMHDLRGRSKDSSFADEATESRLDELVKALTT